MAANRTIIIGADALHDDLVEMTKRIGEKNLITKRLAPDMRKFAHIITGFMKSTIYHNRMVAGADAYYAGYEADRGKSHDYAQRAIKAFPVEDYIAELVEPF